MKQLFITLTLLFASIAGWAFTIGGITYSRISGTNMVVVTSYQDDYNQTCNIPESVTYAGDTYTVVYIGDNAFYSCHNLTKITIPNSVTRIGNFAFLNCVNLTSVIIPNSVTSIGESAFGGCESITSIIIPNSVTNMSYEFPGCLSLKSIKVEPGNPKYDSRDNCNAIIETQSNELIAGCSNSTIPNSVTSIGYSAFAMCRNLTNVTIPKSVCSIGRYAFQSCLELTSVTIPNSVTSIGEDAFINCSSLKDVYNKANTPQSGNGNIPTSCTIHVPKSLKETFKAAAAWKNYTIVDDIPITAVTSITLNTASLSIAEGKTASLTATMTPSDATNKAINWTSSNSNVASVSNGTITAIAPGTATITATAVDGSGVKATCTVTVTRNVSSITLSKTSLSIAAGHTASLTATVAPSDATNKTIIWTSSATNIATVNNGTITAVALGTATITATAADGSGVKATCMVTVTRSVSSITLNKTSLSIVEGQAATLTATVTPTDAYQNVIWTSSNNDIATVSNGTVTAVAPGTATITATAADGSGVETACTVTVTRNVSDITFSKTSLSIVEGQIINISFSVTPEDATNKDVIWTSSATNVAKVNNGIVTGVGLGTTTITATAADGSGVKASCKVTVSSNIYIYISDNTIEVRSNPDKYRGHCVIPKTIDLDGKEYIVTSIGEGAFSGCTNLTSVDIPESVTSIGNNAFYGCSNLTSVDIPDGVTSIGDGAFNECKGLTSITIPDGVTRIGDLAFRDTELTSIIIPKSVTSIGKRAFQWCWSLTSVTIGNSVTSIGYGTFAGCTGLTSVTIPNSVTSIGEEAFWGCTGLTSVTIGKNVTNIGGRAFEDCPALEKVNITDIAAWCRISFDGIEANPLWRAHHLYINDEKVTDLVIPNSVTSIGYGTFAGCTGLTSISIPESVTSIGDLAFRDTELTSIIIPKSVTSIAKSAFKNCDIKSIKVESGNPKFDSRNNCNAIIETQSNTLIIGFKNTVIPESVTSIDNWAFDGCEGLSNITIPENVTSIGSCAFSGCTGLTNFIIPKGVKYINANTFYDCTNLTSVTIPASVRDMDPLAFDGCPNLKDVYNCALRPQFNNGSIPTSCTIHVKFYAYYDYYGASEWENYTIDTGAPINLPTKVTLNKEKIYCKVNENVELKVVSYEPADADKVDVNYSSSNSNVIVYRDGTVQGVCGYWKGKAIITVTPKYASDVILAQIEVVVGDLKDNLKQLVDTCSKIEFVSGTCPGYYNQAKADAYKKSLETAIFAANNSEDEAELQAALDDLRAKREDVENSIVPLTKGYYYIVSAGKGSGYPFSEEVKYDDEMKYALYNKDGFVHWKAFDESLPEEIYEFTADGNDNWYVKNIVDNTYINKGTATYYCDVTTTANATTAQTFEPSAVVGKWTAKPAGNLYVYVLVAGHNGANGKTSGKISIWGTADEANQGKMSLWYLIPVSDEAVETAKKAMASGPLNKLIADIEAENLQGSDAPGYYTTANIATLNAALETAKAATTGDDMIAAMETLKNAYTKATSELNPITEGYYYLVSKYAAYETQFGAPAAMYIAPADVRTSGLSNVRFEKFDENNAHYIFHLTAKKGVEGGFYAQSVMDQYYLNTGDGNDWYGEITTATSKATNAQIFKNYGIGMFWIADETDRYVSRVVRKPSIQNGTIYGWTQFSDNIVEADQWYNAWELVPVTANKVADIVAAQKIVDEAAATVREELREYALTVQDKVNTLIADESELDSEKKTTLKNAWSAAVAAVNAKNYDIVSTAQTLASIKENLEAALADTKEYWKVTSITLDQSTLTITEGNTATLVATVAPEDAINKAIIWTSSNDDVAIVSSGTITAVAPGTATITATAADGSGVSATCIVRVVSAIFTLGDVTGDGNITVTDVVAVVNYITGINTVDLNRDAADINGDGDISVTDAVGIVNLIMDDFATGAQSRSFTDISENVLMIDNVTYESKDIMKIKIKSLVDDITASQFDMAIPFGATVESITPTDRKHSVSYEEINGSVRVVCMSTSNALMQDANIVEITLRMPEQNVTIIDLGNIELACPDLSYVSARSQSFVLDDPTAIPGIKAERINGAVYDLNGRRVTGKLSQGVYIINNKKVRIN